MNKVIASGLVNNLAIVTPEMLDKVFLLMH